MEMYDNKIFSIFLGNLFFLFEKIEIESDHTIP